MDEVSAFVLAGGQSTRMGADKAFVELDGRTLLSRALELVGAVVSNVWIVGSKQKFTGLGQVVEDEFPDHGPLGGIHAGLRASPTDLNLMLAVDMPYLETGFLECLIRKAQSMKNAVTVPRVGRSWQPLCAVYRKQFADLAEAKLRQGQNKIDPLFAQVDVYVVEESELKDLGFSPDLFRNLNTPQELSEVRKSLASL
jgi:molybdenum cofactor guanylyltransferase